MAAFGSSADAALTALLALTFQISKGAVDGNVSCKNTRFRFFNNKVKFFQLET